MNVSATTDPGMTVTLVKIVSGVEPSDEAPAALGERRLGVTRSVTGGRQPIVALECFYSFLSASGRFCE
jgi:hypothetical protein